MHFGNWDGLSWDDVEQRDAHALAAWMADWQHQRAPGGESFTDLIARVADWLADLAAATRRDRVGEVVVVAHAGSIRALLVHAVGLPRDLAFRVRLDVARVSGLLVRGDIARTSCNLAEVAFLNADRVPPSN
jgi:broad specificity phosphatase PhoE